MSVRAEVASLKEQLSRADMERADFDKHKAEVPEEKERRIVRSNVVIFGRNRAEKLTVALVTDSVNTTDAIV